MMLIILGANIYKVTMKHMSNNFDSRTSYAYVVQKIRQHDESGSVDIGEFNGRSSLIMKDDVDGISYDTYLYESDGYLCELLSRADQQMDLSAGTKIIAVESFDVSKENDRLFHVTIDPDSGSTVTLYVSTHCSQKEDNG